MATLVTVDCRGERSDDVTAAIIEEEKKSTSEVATVVKTVLDCKLMVDVGSIVRTRRIITQHTMSHNTYQ